jgi:hypothetical protein
VNDRGGNAAMLRLNVVELPMLFHYRLGDEGAVRKKDSYALFRSTTLHGGLKLTRLISYGTETRGYLNQILGDPNFTDTPLDYQDLDLPVVGGVTFRLGLNYAIFLQHGLSVRGLYDPDEVTVANRGSAEVYQLRPYSLTLGGKVVLY